MHYVIYRGMRVVARVETRDSRVTVLSPREGFESLREFVGRPVGELVDWAEGRHYRWVVNQGAML